MRFIWESQQIGNIILNISFIVLIFAFAFVVCYVISKRRASFIFLGVSFALSVFAFIFDLMWLFILVSALVGCGTFAILFTNLGDLRKFLAAPFRVAPAKNGKFGVEKIFDSHALYEEVNEAVLSLSRSRTGAIITFEKSNTLKDVMKNGVYINAVLSKELLETIFYVGTRLHDGAVVIHGNEIVAASVFFTPSTKPFAVKYGSRHRAAIGISEISDAVTIVVSEETGRISIAVDGELETVSPDNFLRVFENYMTFEEE